MRTVSPAPEQPVSTRHIPMPGGDCRSFTLPDQLWSVLDDVLGLGLKIDAVIRDTVHAHQRHPSVSLDEHLAGVLREVEEYRRDADAEMLVFDAFCTAQPRTPEGLRLIREEAQRLKETRRMIWFGE